MPTTTKSYQTQVARLFASLGYIVMKEWPSFSGVAGCYSPRLDVAVGPFATHQQLGAEYDRLEKRNEGFLSAIFGYHNENVDRHHAADIHLGPCSSSGNFNARCFLAIEIENQVTRKHLMGGAINAVALGRLGILVGWDAKKIRALVRTKAYMAILNQVGKPSFPTTNLVILTRDQLTRAMDSLAPAT